MVFTFLMRILFFKKIFFWKILSKNKVILYNFNLKLIKSISYLII